MFNIFLYYGGRSTPTLLNYCSACWLNSQDYFSNTPPSLVLWTMTFMAIHVLWFDISILSVNYSIHDMYVWGDPVLKNNFIWIPKHCLEICSHPICSWSMSDTSTISRSEGIILLHSTLDISNIMSTLTIGIDADRSIQLTISFIYLIRPHSNMEYWKYR